MEHYKKLYGALTQILDISDEKDEKLKTDDQLKVSISDYILDGNLLVRYNRVPKGFTYEKELKYDIENFDWDIKYQLEGTFQLYLQGFWPIKYLIKGYEVTLNKKYMDLASEIIKSWLEYEPRSKNEFTWYDHSASDRTKIMLYFILVSRINNISRYNNLINEMDRSIEKHADFLYDDDNYTTNNHGIMMDEALYAISRYLDNEKYRNKSISRLKNALKRNFSDNMVNLESAITYHLFNVELFNTIEKLLLKPFGDTCGFNQSSFEKSIDFLIHCAKPDSNFPVIGDSHKSSLKGIKKFSFYQYIKDYPLLKWFLTSGESGNKPEELFKVYEQEGYAFFRNSWDITKQNETSYVSFISGTSILRGHKHYDDLSFTLFSKGKDIFVDSGYLNFEKGVTRDFFISALAHNSVVVDNQSYLVPRRDILIHWQDNINTGIIDYGEKKNYYYVVGKNDMYDGVNITRSLYYLKSGDIVIFDDIQSPDIHTYSQYYHLDPKININDIDVKLEDDNTNVILYDNDITINIFQAGQCDVKFIKGNKNKIGPGILSEYFGQLKETNSLKFSLKARNTRFITLITVNDKNEKNYKKCYINSIPQYNLKEEIVIKEFEKEIRIPLLNYPRKIFKDQKHVEVEQNDRNFYTFKITDTDKDETFAWYILESGKKVDVIWYNKNPVLRYLFTKPGNYQIKYFVMKGKTKKIVDLPQNIIVTNEDITKSNTIVKNGPLEK